MTSSDVIGWCQAIAALSEETGWTTRTFLSPPMREVHQRLRTWMERLGMRVWVDAAGNLHGLYPGVYAEAPRLLIGSHLDTVPHAGAYDGVLGVVLGIALIERMHGRRPSFQIEVLGFSEEEGVRFSVPFIGSRALVGSIDSELLSKEDAHGTTLAKAIRDFGLDPSALSETVLGQGVAGYLEFHIEQGPVLDSLGLPLGVVEAIAGQSRFNLIFRGHANHAGTTPMHLRHDALAGAADWICWVERHANGTPALVATVGHIEALPGAGNVIPGEVQVSLDVRHASDDVRGNAVSRLLQAAHEIATGRNLQVQYESKLEQPAVACDAALTDTLAEAVGSAHRMVSGAGHDAMILAQRVPVAMLFVRSPGGISHHPDEHVYPDDIDAALQAGLRFIELMEKVHA